VITGCQSDDPVSPDNTSGAELMAGGSTTIFNATSNAYSTPAPNLSGADFDLHVKGDAAFEAVFVSRPAVVNQGLGPVYNNTSCINCHARDGRGRPPMPGEVSTSLLFRISVPGVGPDGGPNPVPGFGGQLQERAIHGVPAEGVVQINYTEVPGKFADGSSYSLRKPEYVITAPYKPLPGGVMLSPRIAPPVFGLGLLEAVAESDIVARADESDADGDGISGRANYVWNAETQSTTLGRFGWKAGAPSLMQQTAGAYNQDMGVTSPLFKFEPCHDQSQCENSPGDSPDIDDATLRAATHYVATLAVPAPRRLDDAQVRHGRTLFNQAGCADCHTPSLKTGPHPVSALANQTIQPYTDMLLHDMGEGLADNRPDFLADGREWRTSPLWGIGLTRVVNGHTYFLHDGRARSLMEAVLWHGGEAERARTAVLNMSRADRDALVAFLEAL
jgi:CxxC motif-containing protein (DUF1111 family)